MPPSRNNNIDSSTSNTVNRTQFSTKDVRRKAKAKLGRKRSRQFGQVGEDFETQQLRVNDLKKRSRDLIRLLRHKQDMVAGERQYKERELAALRRDLEDALYLKERKNIISKYHMVRFFERRKAERHLRQTQKRASIAPADSPEREKLKDEVHEAEIDLNYTLYSPLEQKYLSLYDNKKKTHERGAGYKSTNWREVEEAMARQSLHKLRDRQDCLPSAKAKVDDLFRKFRETRAETEPLNHQVDRTEEPVGEDSFFEGD